MSLLLHTVGVLKNDLLEIRDREYVPVCPRMPPKAMVCSIGEKMMNGLGGIMALMKHTGTNVV